MITEPILLADRFEVRPALNSVTDKATAKETRLEARIMNLLCLLIENAGQLVSREKITKEIWDDYGNADEGLTQSISYLRKLLGDDEKKLIETVPKKGYVLWVSVSEVVPLQNEPARVAGKSKRRPKKNNRGSRDLRDCCCSRIVLRPQSGRKTPWSESRCKTKFGRVWQPSRYGSSAKKR